MPRFDISTLEDLRNASREAFKPKYEDEDIVLVLHPFRSTRKREIIGADKRYKRADPVRCIVPSGWRGGRFNTDALIQVPCDSRGCAV